MRYRDLCSAVAITGVPAVCPVACLAPSKPPFNVLVSLLLQKLHLVPVRWRLSMELALGAAQGTFSPRLRCSFCLSTQVCSSQLQKTILESVLFGGWGSLK